MVHGPSGAYGLSAPDLAEPMDKSPGLGTAPIPCLNMVGCPVLAQTQKPPIAHPLKNVWVNIHLHL